VGNCLACWAAQRVLARLALTAPRESASFSTEQQLNLVDARPAQAMPTLRQQKKKENPGLITNSRDARAGRGVPGDSERILWPSPRSCKGFLVPR
jgi:hypothetical protein